MAKLIFIFLSIFSQNVFAELNEETADWSERAFIKKGENRSNIYKLNQNEQLSWVKLGKTHALQYPVEITGLLIPYRPFKNFLNSFEDHPLKKIIGPVAKKTIGFYTEKEFYDWLGLASFPQKQITDVVTSPYYIPEQFLASRVQKNLAMGATILKTNLGEGLTFSCAACHVNQFFGKAVMGMGNKKSHANQVFVLGQKYTPYISPLMMSLTTKATKGEVKMYESTRRNLKSTEAKWPLVLGLDTSLAITALSLSRRQTDAYAQKDPYYEMFPRSNELRHYAADSKPMPWWNVKYKTRWLADGSIVSGNPIFTNILWNEIGRGANLHQLENWMEKNKVVMQQLTAAVFASTPPLWTDYFQGISVDLKKAQAGEEHFKNHCQKCHGTYEKAWSLPHYQQSPLNDQIKTIKVTYHEKTPVIDVETDLNRAQGMKYFANTLNNLALSQKMNTKIVPQEGYVPPPLDGIWSRYPYLHNASVPNLCALLTPSHLRPKHFYLIPSDNIKTDFDKECVGLPTGAKTPPNRQIKENLLDTSKEGLSNKGHDFMLFDDTGREIFTLNQKRELIEFLKTL